MSKPYTVVLLPDSTKVHEADLRDVDMEDVHVARLLAPTVSAATALAQNMCSQLNQGGPTEPIDWAVLFMCEGHHADIKNQPDTLNISLSPKEVRALVSVLFSPGSFGNLSADLAVSMLEKLRVAGNEINLWETKNEG